MNLFKRFRRQVRVDIVCPHGEFIPAAYGPAVRATGRYGCKHCDFHVRLSTFRGEVTW